MSASERQASSGAEKAAILLSLLGEDDAAPVLRCLPSDALERITEEVSKLSRVPVEVTMQVLEEYQQIMTAQEYIAVGGQDHAVRMLVKAFGENAAKGIMQRLARVDDGKTLRFDALKKADPQQLARFLAGEHEQTKALILGHMDAKQAASFLMKLEPDVRAECVRRLATMKRFSPDAAARAARVLHRRFGSNGDQTKSTNSEFTNLADVMNRLEPMAARQILETIEAEEPQIATNIRDLMFAFENLLEVPEPDLRELINIVDKKTLVVALKGTGEDLRTCIFRTMSPRAVEILREDSEIMGAVRSRDVQKAQSEIVAVARKLEAEGKIVLKSEEEDEYVF